MKKVPLEELPVKQPTYMADIRHFFEPVDIEHMAPKGYDLSTYAGVKKHALAIFTHTSPPNADMPPEPDRKWSPARSETFRNWILAGYPVGVAVASGRPAQLRTAAAGRIRRNVADLNKAEIAALKTAFSSIVAKDPSDPYSFYAISSIHGLPQSYCLHHENKYNPWHRVYLKVLEDALRAVPGCQDVTLPYWDIRTPIPNLLKKPPFDSYVVPVELRNPYGSGYKTQRYDQATIDANLLKYDVFKYIDSALGQSLWGAFGVNGFQEASIAAHDGGHTSIGPTMADQNVSSYDPIFWFFHCNLDRIWLKWQRNVSGTTLTGFKSTLSGSTDWLSGPLNVLEPFLLTPDQTIDFADVTYEEPAMVESTVAFENMVGSIDATRTFKIRRSPEMSVTVKNIDRLNIPGTFVVVLLADGEPVAHRAFFQPNPPRECATCRKLGLVSINFRVEQDRVFDRKLSIAIELPGQESMGVRFPVSGAGNPTINARLLIEDA
ncbi:MULTISPECIES: tyrosinase family protein [unclassified Mesorhizobium]|uniref:tyrosinase family protein n=1 Tax=unclassified Mesorhizobium TaxID=325217 RepID=UPI0003CEDB41|nr:MULTISPECIES: tyrosinase family protein [unclassified Mesorhizobium]ESY55551.1 hypothetical protein X745_11835 [Mesorhizobium sp. LNJC374B00]ESY57260.1 hypothetical protein X744_19365 [Mesorhizobium sp. LNJC372A00]WJI79403.1 tyrosinase family protein [Mesorhizobium sp. C374B]WJI85938.1 tyrosinase family protein [Mesorhizobium sp. C372A]